MVAAEKAAADQGTLQVFNLAVGGNPRGISFAPPPLKVATDSSFGYRPNPARPFPSSRPFAHCEWLIPTSAKSRCSPSCESSSLS